MSEWTLDKVSFELFKTVLISGGLGLLGAVFTTQQRCYVQAAPHERQFRLLDIEMRNIDLYARNSIYRITKPEDVKDIMSKYRPVLLANRDKNIHDFFNEQEQTTALIYPEDLQKISRPMAIRFQYYETPLRLELYSQPAIVVTPTMIQELKSLAAKPITMARETIKLTPRCGFWDSFSMLWSGQPYVLSAETASIQTPASPRTP